MDRQARQEYFSANRELYDELISAFEVSMTPNPDRILMYRTADTPFGFIEGQYTPEEMAVIDPSLQDLQEAADEQNALLQDAAESSLTLFRGLLNYLRPNDQPPLFELDGQSTRMPFRHAVWRRTFISDDEAPTTDGRISILDLFQVGSEREIDAASVYELDLAVDGLREFLVVIAVNGRPEAVSRSVDAAHDPLYDRCVDMFGSESKATDLYWGKFETEDELDNALETIATATQGLYPAEEVRALLADVREHALRGKEAEEWVSDLNFNQPTLETLQNTIRYLRDLT